MPPFLFLSLHEKSVTSNCAAEKTTTKKTNKKTPHMAMVLGSVRKCKNKINTNASTS